MEVTLPASLFISLTTLMVSVGGTWFVTLRRVKELEAKVSGHDAKFDGLISDISDMKSDIKALKSDINSVKSDVKELKSDINALKSDVSALKVDNAKMQANINSIGEKLDLIISGKINFSLPAV